MNWKELYGKVVKTICEKELDLSKDIYEPEPPKSFFDGVMYVDENAPKNSFISLRLNETIAKEEDYKEFCEYVFAKIGEDINDYLGQKTFKNFKKGE